jgi:hypothetical protein
VFHRCQTLKARRVAIETGAQLRTIETALERAAGYGIAYSAAPAVLAAMPDAPFAKFRTKENCT